MSELLSFEDLMARLRANNPEAARQIFSQFAHRLLALARSRLDTGVRRKEDPEDVMQSVFKTFFRRCAAGEFDLHSWDSLWGMLTIITVRKCSQHRKYFHAARRNIAREIDVTPPDEGGGWEATSREPTPAEAAVLTETMEDVMRGLDAGERAILVLSLQGHSVAEISQQIGRTERTVQRVLQRVRQRLERMCAAPQES